MRRTSFSAFCAQPVAMLIAVFALALSSSSFALGQAESVLHDFIAMPHGSYSYSTLISDAAGNLYGTTFNGGTFGFGTVFKLAPGTSGKWTQTVIYHFQGGSDGSNPVAGLVFDAAGNLYGTTESGGGGLNGCCGTAFKLSPNSNGTWNETLLHVFGTPVGTGDASTPMSGLIFDNAGNLYGTTEYGGTADYGTVFMLAPGSQGTWTESVLYSFIDEADGGYPMGSLTLDAAGNLYGTSSIGGDVNCFNGGTQPWGCGVIFKLAHNSNGSWSESALHSFDQFDGVFPVGNVIFDSAGNLYGTTQNGPGINCSIGCGTVFKMTPGTSGSWTLKTVYTFAGGPDGETPLGGLVQSADGHFYGTTRAGGNTTNCTYGCGTVFELTPTTTAVWKEKIIHNFSGSSTAPFGVDGSGPAANVLFDQAGNLYGTAANGGTAVSGAGCNGIIYCGGTVFKLAKNSSGQWITSLLYAFAPSGDGLSPAGGLIADGVGNLYGTTQYGGGYGLGSVYQMVAVSGGGYKERVIYSFTGGTDGQNPSGSLASDAAGNLYGTTYYGGSTTCSYNIGCGLVFELSPASNGKWTETILYRFTGASDGQNPVGPLTFDAAGNIFGASTGNDYTSIGGVFELSPSSGGWTFSEIHAFSGIDGAFPNGGLVFDASGNLYGTAGGGAKNSGVVYELSPGASGWTLTLLHTFQGKTDGTYSQQLVFDHNGHLFGTTAEGGNAPSCGGYGCGVVFELVQVAGKWQQKVIYTFQGGNDGQFSLAPLVFDSAGNAYGSTVYGGGPIDGGTVFKLSQSAGTWSESVLHSFDQIPFDAFNPGALLLDSTGHLFGASRGGEDFNGAVFEISLNQAATASRRPIAPSQRRPRPAPPGPLSHDLSKTATSGKGGN
jgi:uncharacterized repeat protein (TIGR03803 family)